MFNYEEYLEKLKLADEELEKIGEEDKKEIANLLRWKETFKKMQEQKEKKHGKED